MQKMSEKEATEILKGAIKKPNTEDGYMGQAITLAIKTLEKQSMVNEILHECTELKRELDAYKVIGTVEQCREAVERMKPKGFIQTEKFNTTMWQCPICYSELYSGQNYCDECGNFIGWDGLE